MEIWYHVSPVTNRDSILQNGLLPGNNLGKTPRPGFADSLQHIYVSRDLQTATWWARRLANGPELQDDYEVFAIKPEHSGLRLVNDPQSANYVNSTVHGWTVDAEHIHPDLITSERVVQIQKGFPAVAESYCVLKGAGWTVSDESYPPGSNIVWTARGFKEEQNFRGNGETRPEAWGKLRSVALR